MIIDSHHHLWKYNEKDYGWMDDGMSELRKDHLPGDLETEIRACGVGGTIVVQARQTIEETRWLLSLAEKHEFIRGVVGWLDICSPGLEKVLEGFVKEKKLVGIRHVIQDEPDDDFMLNPEFTRGIGLLSSYDLSYDLLIFPRHLERAVKMVRMFPGQRFVLDHMAKPPIGSGMTEPWKTNLEALASEPNVWCKISGMVTEADFKNPRFEDFIPYIDIVVNAFGPDRVMIGSDWPVCRLAGEYSDVMEIHYRYFESFDERDREKAFSRNCSDFYKLESSI